MLPVATPVLVTWPGCPMLCGTVVGAGRDGGLPVYHVVSPSGYATLALEAALTDLRLFSGIPLSAFAEPGRA